MPKEPKEIKLVLKGDLIAPEDSSNTSANKTTVKHGESVRFTLGPQFKSGAPIKFDKTSPLDDGAMTAVYGRDLNISATAPAGSYPYSCEATDQSGKARHSAGGGEIIIIQGS